MADQPDSLGFELLRAVRGDIAGLRGGQQDIMARLARIEAGQARMRLDQAGDAEMVVQVQAQVDRMRDRIERIEKRLDIID